MRKGRLIGKYKEIDKLLFIMRWRGGELNYGFLTFSALLTTICLFTCLFYVFVIYSINKFFDEQFKKLERVTSRFSEFREVLLGVVKTSAR